MTRVAAIVLAAGASSRMGRPKQLLEIDGETLIRRSARTVLRSCCDAVFVVVGAHADLVAGEVSDLAVEVVENFDWQDGIGSSIRAGIGAVAAATEPIFDAALITLADQPGVTPALLDRLLDELRAGGRELVACEYAGTLGAPALFARRYFEELCHLEADRGGKSVLAAHADAVARVPFPDGALDIDTPADYDRLKQRPRRAPGRE